MTEKERTEAMRKAAIEADVALVMKAMGKTPVQKNGVFVHPDYDDFVIVSPNEWIRQSGATAKYGEYADGNALHYLVEYEGIGFDAAIARICEITAPHLLPNQPIARMRPQDRIELIKKQNVVQEILEEQEGTAEDDDSLTEENTDYPSEWPGPNDSPDEWETAMKTVETLDGIDRRVMDYLLSRRWAFVGAARFHKYIVFPGPQPDGKPGFFYVRSLYGTRPDTMQPLPEFRPFAKWAWHAGPEATTLSVFENPVEAAACMSLVLQSTGEMDKVRSMNVLALSTSEILPLLTYLEHHDVLALRLCMGNTENGRAVTDMIRSRLKDAYEITVEPSGAKHSLARSSPQNTERIESPQRLFFDITARATGAGKGEEI